MKFLEEDKKISTELKKCPVCHAEQVSDVTKKYIGFINLRSVVCQICGAKFIRVDDKLKLVRSNTHSGYLGDILAIREWNTIEQGGKSDERQAEVDRMHWFEQLRAGKIKINFLKGNAPIILKKNEEVCCVIPNVTLKESRAVRVTQGGYAGPSIRVAKRVSFRLGRFASTSQSHQEIKIIDRGVLTLTNQRVVFSGGFKTVSVTLEKIISIDPFSDGISLHKEGREKTQYFLWPDPVGSVEASVQGRTYREPFSGLIFQYLVESFRVGVY